ncbi:DUF3696 domain-containing protein [Variovorax sp.]|uniref:DUF3696 domain-containing protein n=1 Tax=Variovorax sp. TaxID=1871043 RepID=UPI0037D99AEA
MNTFHRITVVARLGCAANAHKILHHRKKFMASIDAVRIKNLRSLVDTDWIAQKPITILVGRNSAGKSTFARFFPLLKQSVSERKQSPILWFGQYVDFGQYSVAVHNKDPKSSISFGFKITLSKNELARRNPAYHYMLQKKESSKPQTFPVEVEISLGPGSEQDAADTVAQRLKINILGFQVAIRFSQQSVHSLSIDDLEIWKPKAAYYSHVEFGSALPSLSFYKERAALPEEQGKIAGKLLLEAFDPFNLLLTSEIRAHVHGNLGLEKQRQMADQLILADGDQFLEGASAVLGGDQRWSEYVSSLTPDSKAFRNLQRAVLCARLTDVLRILDTTISAHFNSVKYIEPLRATAQRYYRKQDLAINELDTKGANVAQFLQGLPEWRRSDFDRATRRLFGFAVRPRAQGGHIELVLEHVDDGKAVNMADAGVGFSQLLPILLQFWSTDDDQSRSNRIASVAPTTLVVEQPELHLHPAYQATLADLFCETAKPRPASPAKVVAETHSPALVNRLGTLIAEGKFNSKDIQILLFEQDEVTGQTTIRTASFDSEGILSNWPYGFFEPEA